MYIHNCCVRRMKGDVRVHVSRESVHNTSWFLWLFCRLPVSCPLACYNLQNCGELEYTHREGEGGEERPSNR